MSRAPRLFLLSMAMLAYPHCGSHLAQGTAARVTLSEPEAPHPVVRFVIDPGYDASRIFGILSSDDPAGLESRATSMGIGLDVARHIRGAPTMAEAREVLAPLVDSRYVAVADDLEVSRGQLSQEWAQVETVFWSVVANVIDRSWRFDEYRCVVSAFHRGLSDWVGNQIAIGYDLTPSIRRRIVAHEIVLSLVFQEVRAELPHERLPDTQLWALAEMTAVFILDDANLRPFWPNTPEGGTWFANSNYPQLAPLEPQLLEIYANRASFSDYVESAIPILRRLDE